MRKINLFKNWMTESLFPCDYSNLKRYKNYLAKVSVNDEGLTSKEFMAQSKESDLFFNVAPLKVGDIVVANCWDSYKRRQYNHYYVVTEITSDYITFCGVYDNNQLTTYLKAYKALKLMRENNTI